MSTMIRKVLDCRERTQSVGTSGEGQSGGGGKGLTQIHLENGAAKTMLMLACVHACVRALTSSHLINLFPAISDSDT